MRKSGFLAFGLMLMAIFAVSAFAQGGATPTNGTKIGLVDTALFLEDKPGAGITKYKNAVNSLNAEFKAVNDELQTLGTQYQQKVDEYNKLKGSNAPVGNLDTLASTIQDMETTIKRKQEDAKSKYERRYDQVVGPVMADIGKAMNDYAKQKGYAVLLDGAGMQEAHILLAFDEKYDVTKDFITFYNARPASAGGNTASTGPSAAPTKP